VSPPVGLRPDSPLAAPLAAAVARCLAAGPVVALLIWERADGAVESVAVPSSEAVKLGLALRQAELLRDE